MLLGCRTSFCDAFKVNNSLKSDKCFSRYLQKVIQPGILRHNNLNPLESLFFLLLSSNSSQLIKKRRRADWFLFNTATLIWILWIKLKRKKRADGRVVNYVMEVENKIRRQDVKNGFECSSIAVRQKQSSLDLHTLGPEPAVQEGFLYETLLF